MSGHHRKVILSSSSSSSSSLEQWENNLSTPHKIAIQRMQYLGLSSVAAVSTFFDDAQPPPSSEDNHNNDEAIIIDGGLPMQLATLLQNAFNAWTIFYKTITKSISDSESSSSSSGSEENDNNTNTNDNTQPSSPSLASIQICNSHEIKHLQQTLSLLSNTSQLDTTLSEEIQRTTGTQSIYTRLIQQINTITTKLVMMDTANTNANTNTNQYYTENVEDILVKLQDTIFQNIYSHLPFTMESKCMSFTNDELIRRLPLVYHLKPVVSSSRDCVVGSSSSSSRSCDDDLSTPTITRTIFINQVTKRQSAQSDVGYVMWPSAIILSRWLLSNPHILFTNDDDDDDDDDDNDDEVKPSRDNEKKKKKKKKKSKSVLELGAGCGLVGITAAAIIQSQIESSESTKQHYYGDDDTVPTKQQEQQQQVIITDVNDLVLENIQQNINVNDVSSISTVAKLDFYVQSGTNHSGKWIESSSSSSSSANAAATTTTTTTADNVDNDDDVATSEEEGKEREPVDVILAADIICQPSDAIAASKTIYDALKPNGEGCAYVVCANSEHRYGVEIFASECEKRGLHVVTIDVKEMYNGELLFDDDNSLLDTAAGYVDGMLLTFFEITKYQ